jgi:hypothetical protein
MKQRIGLAVGATAGTWFIAWLVEGRGPWGLATGLLSSALLLMWFGYMIPRARMVLVNAGFFVLLSGVFSSYANWIPQVEGPAPPSPGPSGGPAPEGMPVDELAGWGEELIFGSAGRPEGIGKGQCPLCHGFVAGAVSERAPNLAGIAARAAARVQEPRYLHPDSIQAESFAGSGRATTAVEYIAESHVCPSCYVAAGYGVKGTNDTESPMAAIHKAPIGLTIDEQIAVDTFLFYRSGGDVPPVAEIRAAYEKFLPPGERAPAPPTGPIPPAGDSLVVLPTDTPQDMISKLGCAGCHKIPATNATVGVIGPLLIEGTTASRRLTSSEYVARVRAGKAHASTPKEYVMESIVNPNAFIVPGFATETAPPASPMPHGFGRKLTYDALDRLSEFLLAIDEADAIKAGLLEGPAAPTGADVTG